MRLYIPSTIERLAGERLKAGRGYAITPALIAALGEDLSRDELEYAAFMAAAEESIALVAETQRRVVCAVDLEIEGSQRLGEHPAFVECPDSIPWAALASIHVDGSAAARTVRKAFEGDGAALEDLAEVDLEWYSPQERFLFVAPDRGDTP